MESEKTASCERTLTLPEEIIEEISSRLPVKSLLKFRCVSKSWRSLIDSKRFIRKHLQNSTKTKSLAHHRVAFVNYDTLLQCTSLLSLSDEHAYTSKFDNPPNLGQLPISIVGCCNGLVSVLVDSRHFMLWNPSIRIHKELPDIDDDKLTFRNIRHYGFGWDESSGDYKVFVVDRFQTETTSKLYSLKNDAWKETNTADFSLCYCKRGKFASGKLHWTRANSAVENSTDPGFKWEIVAFDLNREVHGMIDQPSYSYSKDSFRPSLGIFVICLYDTQTLLEVWVMKQQSWEKMVFRPHDYDPIWKFQNLAPFFIGRDRDEKTLIIGESRCTETMVYVESLVSLVSERQHQRLEESYLGIIMRAQWFADNTLSVVEFMRQLLI